ncbi:restriction endonuclease subunit S [Methanobacterium formicicum]|uniref:restriction endonuclease subunit S n=1 Tax=Methanobacterium formicicum TaxID=2162 RepID=UPI00248F9489|nr:restriction endonuclease subunit S [Methanobacterium formicicum]
MSVPKLRFPEFDGEWEEKKLVELTSGGMYGLNAAAKDFDGVNKYIRITDINETSNNFVPNPLCSPEGDLDEKFLLKEDDLVFARTGASTGKSYLYKKSDGKLFFAGFLIKFHINKANSRFVFYNTLRTQYNNWVKIMSVRSGYPAINSKDLGKIKLRITSVMEQEKIASFLSKVDSKIDLLEKKQELWETYKKGIMKQIFSQKLRFKDENGEDYPDWEEEKLSEVSDVRAGTHESPKYIQDGYPLITSKNLSNGKIDFENVNYISKSDYYAINKRSKVHIGDILFGMIGTIGNPVFVKSEGFAIKNVALIKEIDILKNNYLIYLLKSEIIDKQFYLLNAGGTQKFVALGLIRNLNVPVPTISEQIKISNFLFNIEKRGDKIKKELTLIKKFKKGLLQQMFC